MRRKCSRYYSETKKASKNEPHFQGPKNMDMLQFHANDHVLVTFFFSAHCNCADFREFFQIAMLQNHENFHVFQLFTTDVFLIKSCTYTRGKQSAGMFLTFPHQQTDKNIDWRNPFRKKEKLQILHHQKRRVFSVVFLGFHKFGCPTESAFTSPIVGTIKNTKVSGT